MTSWVRTLAKDGIRTTPLHLAAREGHSSICSLILKVSCDKNPSNINGRTPLHLAAENGHFDVCKLLLDCVENFSPEDKYGKTPLQYAQTTKNHKIVKLFKNTTKLELKLNSTTLEK